MQVDSMMEQLKKKKKKLPHLKTNGTLYEYANLQNKLFPRHFSKLV